MMKYCICLDLMLLNNVLIIDSSVSAKSPNNVSSSTAASVVNLAFATPILSNNSRSKSNKCLYGQARRRKRLG